MKRLLFALLVLLASCYRPPSEEMILATMSGKWFTQYNIEVDVDFVSGIPSMTYNGNFCGVEVLSIDRDNMVVRFKEKTARGYSGMLKLEKVKENGYILILRYDGAIPLVCGFAGRNIK